MVLHRPIEITALIRTWAITSELPTTRPGWSGFPVRFSFQHWFGSIHFAEPASLET
jgi:uncharacterized membrane protein YhdT